MQFKVLGQAAVWVPGGTKAAQAPASALLHVKSVEPQDEHLLRRVGAGEFGHWGAVTAEAEGFDEQFVAGGVPADLFHAGSGVLCLVAEALERASAQAEHEIRFGGQDATGHFARTAAKFEEGIFFAWQAAETAAGLQP